MRLRLGRAAPRLTLPRAAPRRRGPALHQRHEAITDAFRCGPGCASCCHRRIEVFAVEAEPIATELAMLAARDPDLRARIRRQADDPEHSQICPLLVEDRCSVYDARPLICRSHGLPVLVNTDAGPAVSVCPLYFDAQEIPGASILNLEALIAPLAVLAEPTRERLGSASTRSHGPRIWAGILRSLTPSSSGVAGNAPASSPPLDAFPVDRRPRWS